MRFARVLRAFGAGGPTVDAVLPDPNARPGETLRGVARVAGGAYATLIDTLAVTLVTRVEAEDGDALLEFGRAQVAEAFWLPAGERRDLPFALEVPWETPLTHLGGQHLAGMTLGVRAAGHDALHEVAIHPGPAQEKILTAFAGQGFRFRHAEVEHGAIYGVRQELPFYQEILLVAPPELAKAVDEVEVTFIADAAGVEVILEFDKHGGLLSEGRDVVSHFRVEHDDADVTDWTSVVEGWIHQALVFSRFE